MSPYIYIYISRTISQNIAEESANIVVPIHKGTMAAMDQHQVTVDGYGVMILVQRKVCMVGIGHKKLIIWKMTMVFTMRQHWFRK